MRMGGERHTPAISPPKNRPGTHCAGACVGPQDRSGRVRKILPPPEFNPRTVQAVTNLDFSCRDLERGLISAYLPRENKEPQNRQ
jgi:hypothetical protein